MTFSSLVPLMHAEGAWEARQGLWKTCVDPQAILQILRHTPIMPSLHGTEVKEV